MHDYIRAFFPPFPAGSIRLSPLWRDGSAAAAPCFSKVATGNLETFRLLQQRRSVAGQRPAEFHLGPVPASRTAAKIAGPTFGEVH